MKIVFFVIILNVISWALTTHIYWLFYATNEKEDEYIRHPIFEPETFHPLWYYPLGVALVVLVGSLSAANSLFWMTLHADAMSVYVDSANEHGKSFWKFWRWGMHIIPHKYALPFPD